MELATKTVQQLTSRILPDKPHQLSYSPDWRYHIPADEAARPKRCEEWEVRRLQYSTLVSEADRGVLLTRSYYDMRIEPPKPMPREVGALAKGAAGGEKKKLSLSDYKNKKTSGVTTAESTPEPPSAKKRELERAPADSKLLPEMRKPDAHRLREPFPAPDSKPSKSREPVVDMRYSTLHPSTSYSLTPPQSSTGHAMIVTILLTQIDSPRNRPQKPRYPLDPHRQIAGNAQLIPMMTLGHRNGRDRNLALRMTVHDHLATTYHAEKIETHWLLQTTLPATANLPTLPPLPMAEAGSRAQQHQTRLVIPHQLDACDPTQPMAYDRAPRGVQRIRPSKAMRQRDGQYLHYCRLFT